MGKHQVLVLNADYTPQQRPRPLSKALTLLYKNRAEVIAVRDGIKIKSGGKEFDCPSVIRIKTFHNVPRRGMTWHAKSVLQRDNYTCIFCGKTLAKSDATIDHIYPKSLCKKYNIPANTWANTACACRPCQTRKGNKTMSEAGMKLLWEPRTPRTNYFVVTSETDPTWKQYLEV